MFTVTEAAELAGMKQATVNLWLRNTEDRDRLIGGEEDEIPEASGVAARLSLDTVFALVMAAWLRNLGVEPKIACKAANALAAIRGPLEPKDKLPTQETTLCAIVKADGEASLVSMKGKIDAAKLVDAAWILPLSDIQFKVMRAAYRKAGLTGFVSK